MPRRTLSPPHFERTLADLEDWAHKTAIEVICPIGFLFVILLLPPAVPHLD